VRPWQHQYRFGIAYGKEIENARTYPAAGPALLTLSPQQPEASVPVIGRKWRRAHSRVTVTAPTPRETPVTRAAFPVKSIIPVPRSSEVYALTSGSRGAVPIEDLLTRPEEYVRTSHVIYRCLEIADSVRRDPTAYNRSKVSQMVCRKSAAD
jgi:hypothetical protein